MDGLGQCYHCFYGRFSPTNFFQAKIRSREKKIVRDYDDWGNDNISYWNSLQYSVCNGLGIHIFCNLHFRPDICSVKKWGSKSCLLCIVGITRLCRRSRSVMTISLFLMNILGIELTKWFWILNPTCLLKIVAPILFWIKWWTETLEVNRAHKQELVWG